jgi:hypothetical protein
VGLTPTAREQLDALTAARNTDGGWGYTAGHASRLEPTSLALMALAAAGSPADPTVLARWPGDRGLLVDPQTRMVNASENAVALLAAHRPGVPLAALCTSVATALAGMRGVKLPPSNTNRQDNALEGWPWTANTFSWVEPTAWCVLGLKKWTRTHPNASVEARVVQGERLLIDRVCKDGGWNYGNSNALGKELFPYVPTTAIALLALLNHDEHEAVKKSAAHLWAHGLDERSGLSLSLCRIALGLCAYLGVGESSPSHLGRRRSQLEPPAASAVPDVRARRLAEIDDALRETWRVTRYMGNLASTALALYAEAGAADRYAAFRL